MKPNNHVKIIDSMRGLAALAVTLCHIGGASFESYTHISYYFSYGQLGVHIFFVISGFVMPWSLDKIQYNILQFGRFIGRRSVRIDPPYYATILLYLIITLVLSLRPQYAGIPFEFEYKRFLLHLGYLIPLSDYNWYTNIFWTLSIEFQYYIIIGLLFPFIKKNNISLIAFLLLFAITPYFIEISKSDMFIFEYQGLFSLGIIAWANKQNKMNKYLCHTLAAIQFIIIMEQVHIPAAISGIISYLLIVGVEYRIEKIQWLGKISYSLYLTHPLILVTLGGLIRRIPENLLSKSIIFLMLLTLSLLFAHIFWKYIEVPSQTLSKKWFPNKPNA